MWTKLEPLVPFSLTRALAMDCEMVGVGPTGEESLAARVSVVNQYGKCVYDKYIKPTQPVTDYRTAVSGVRPEHLKQGGSFPAAELRKDSNDWAHSSPFGPISGAPTIARVLTVSAPWGTGLQMALTLRVLACASEPPS